MKIVITFENGFIKIYAAKVSSYEGSYYFYNDEDETVAVIEKRLSRECG